MPFLPQGALFRVCKAYAVYDENVGYCQGMGFLAGMLLMYMTEEEAFWTLERMLRDPKYHMRGFYMQGMPSVLESMCVFSELIRWHLPKVSAHFEGQGLPPAVYATQWFLTLFSYNFPMEVGHRFVLTCVFFLHALHSLLLLGLA